MEVDVGVVGNEKIDVGNEKGGGEEIGAMDELARAAQVKRRSMPGKEGFVVYLFILCFSKYFF